MKVTVRFTGSFEIDIPKGVDIDDAITDCIEGDTMAPFHLEWDDVDGAIEVRPVETPRFP